MYGSSFIQNPFQRILWALARAISGQGALEFGHALRATAEDVLRADAGRLSTVAESPFFALWAAVIANRARHELPVPPWVTDCGLRAFADRLQLKKTEGPAVPSPSGSLYTAGQGPDQMTSISARTGVETSLVGRSGKFLLLGGSDLTQVIVGEHPGRLAEDPDSFRDPLVAGLDFLRRVSPDQYERLETYVRVISSIEAEPGLLQSLAAGEWPGYIILRARNLAPLVGDQLVHETTHQLIDALLATRSELLESFQRAPSALSPFFNQPRACPKLVHGVLSYLEVLRFWKRVLEAQAWSDVTLASAQRRHDHVLELCREGLRGLRAAASQEEWPLWRAFLEEVSPQSDVLDELLDSRPVEIGGESVAQRISRLGLNPMEQAEVMLALAGHKVSRVSVAPDMGTRLARAIAPQHVPLFSRRVWTAVPDRLKGTFSNIAEQSFEYFQPPPGAFLYAYVGADDEATRRAAHDDEQDEAGAHFGIPECCRSFFSSSWEEAVARFGGDLAALMLARAGAAEGERAPWQCNVWSMYLGLGATWHFPCSLSCSNTANVIDARVDALSTIAPDLAESILRAQRRPIVVSDHGLLAGDHPDGRRDIVDLRGADAPTWTAPLRHLQSVGPLRREAGGWRASDDRPFEHHVGEGARVLTWQW